MARTTLPAAASPSSLRPSLAAWYLTLAALPAAAAPPYDFLQHGIREARIVPIRGVPQLRINGEAVPPLMFFYNLETPTTRYWLDSQVREAAASGIHLYSTTFDGWPWDGSPPDYSAADRQLDLFLRTDPQAVFLLRINVNPDARWAGWRDRESLRRTDDIRYRDGSTRPVSAASDRYFQAFLASVRKMIRHYEASPYAGHTLGYHVAGQNTGEWFLDGYWEKGPDYSPVNAAAFRGWLKQHYADDASLARAWGRKRVTFANAQIPVPKPGRFPIHDLPPGAKIQAFYRLPRERDWVDYSLYCSDLISQRLLDIARVVREETAGKRLVAFFYGYIFELPGSMSGHLRMDRILASPDIDILAAPFSYSGREPGQAGAAMTAFDSVAAHGKLWIDEDDLRTHVDLEGEPDVPRPETASATRSLLERNMATTLVHRAGTWWMDLKGIGSFEDPRLWPVMKDFGLPNYAQLYSQPAPFRPGVAVIVDERSVAFQASDREMTAQRRSLRDNLAKTGAEVGYYYLGDFLSGLVPRCKAYFFVNDFYLDDDQIAKIRARLETEGATAIWQYAPGYLGPSGPDPNRAARLTGIRLSVHNGHGSSAGAGSLAGERWGNPRNLAPRLIVTDPQAMVLGRYRSDHRVSAASKRDRGFTSVFLGDIELTPAMLRALLRHAGVHIWSDGDDIIQTDGLIFAIHSSASGARDLHLPAGVGLASARGEPLARGPASFTISFGASGETRWFRLVK